MSKNVNQLSEPKFVEIERKLEGNEPGYHIHETLQPLELHELYHKLKPEYYQPQQFLRCFKRWEIEVSKRIASHFYGYLPISPVNSNIKIKFNKYLGWIRDESSWIGTDENTMHFYKVFNYFMHTSHIWLTENVIFTKKDYQDFEKLLINIKAPEEFITESSEVFPKFLFTKEKFNSASKFVMEQFNPKNKKSIAYLLQSLVRNNNVALNEVPLIFPFINVERLALYFWLEQKAPKMTPLMILSELLGDEDIEKRSWDVFIVWLWKLQIIVSDKNMISKRSLQDQILLLLSNLSKNKTGKRTYKLYDQQGWDDFSADNITGIKNLKSIQTKLIKDPEYNINYKLPSLELLNKILPKNSPDNS